MLQTDLSIIVPVYNASKLINRCLDSIFNQSTQYQFEVILIDDGSTDNSIELIKARKEPNIILYHQQKKAGNRSTHEQTKPARKTSCRSHKRNPEADKAQNR